MAQIEGSAKVTGNKHICDNRCMCQPEDHGGKGACGAVIDAEEANEALVMVRRLKARRTQA